MVIVARRRHRISLRGARPVNHEKLGCLVRTHGNAAVLKGVSKINLAHVVLHLAKVFGQFVNALDTLSQFQIRSSSHTHYLRFTSYLTLICLNELIELLLRVEHNWGSI